MYGLYLRRLEKDKLDWYKSHGIKPPNHVFETRPPPKTKADVQTYTTTTILDTYAPNAPPADEKLSYWEGKGAGIEPVEFRNSIVALRSTNVISKEPVSGPKIGKTNNCFTPYENDVQSFNAFEITLKELKKQSEHLVKEMDRVEQEWNRPAKEYWFMCRGKEFSVEHSRFMELSRRKANIKKYRKSRDEYMRRSQTQQTSRRHVEFVEE